MGAKVVFFFRIVKNLSFFYLQISKISRTFADVIELNRHIEILLLSNDCVIVPDLGGFMTHHVDARYDNEDHMFVPPVRTLGFNPQLTMNDSLLAQSYIEAYDLSYPEAMRCIEAEVNELKQQLYNDGYFEMSGIGGLTINEDGHIVFRPCEAGLLTPSLYALGTFEMLPLNSKGLLNDNIREDISRVTTTPSTEKAATKTEESAIIVKMSWIRNSVAIAASILLFFLLTPPVDNSQMDGNTQMNISQVELLPLPKKVEAKKLDTSVVNNQKDTTISTVVSEQSLATEKKEPKEDITTTEESTYTLVLASQVAQQGAELFVSKMKQSGYADTRIHIHNHVRRVVYGHYDSEGAAYKALKKLHSSSDKFDEAWVYKTR